MLLLCPELVGRASERADLRARVAGLGAGHGGLAVLVGEAGAGKSRLLAEATAAAAERGIPVLAGRAVPGTRPVPYRPLSEAFLAAFRTTAPPPSPDLAGFAGHLARLVPSWPVPAGSAGDGADESPVLLGEAVVRLLRRLGDGRGCLLVLEDLHWADAETLAVVEYLADAARDEPVLCIATARPGDEADAVVDRIERRRPGTALRVAPLGDDDLARMVAACLGAPDPAVAEFVRAHADGSPFLVEELLAGLAASGALVPEGGGWTVAGELTPTVPARLEDSVGERLAALDPVARRVMGAAALLGRRFDWELIPGIAEVDGRAVVDAMRAAVDGQLIAVDGSGFVFRHALTREAVLADVLPPERAAFARRAWPAVERAHPGLPGPTCELAAALAEAAGEPEAAAARWVLSAQRAADNAGLVSAEATARRAQRLAPRGSSASIDADELLVRVLVAAGKPAEAAALGAALAPRMADAGADGQRQADLLLTLSRAALTAGDPAGAADDLERARAVLGSADPAAAARLDALGAHIALDQQRLDDAIALAARAADAAVATGQPEVECEALEVLGRLHRGPEGMPFLERAADVAARHGLGRWHLRARHEIALRRWAVDGKTDDLAATRDLAARSGALVTVAVMDLALADLALSQFDREACAAHAFACADASRRYGLATESVAHLWCAGACALAGDDAGLDAAAALALSKDPDDPRILGDLYGRVHAARAIVNDDLEALPGILDTMMEHVRVAPTTTSIFPNRILWLLLHVIDDDDLGAAARAEYVEQVTPAKFPIFGVALEVADAVVLGRAGDREGAEAAMAGPRALLATYSMALGTSHASLLLAARAAIRDGWGDPVGWLRECEAFFAARGYERVARRCRTLIGSAGAPVPRKGRGESEVPMGLRALGVTSREVDVLKLVAAGRTNREIAEQLFLSAKTVERHMASLFARTATRGRKELGDLARRHGVGVGEDPQDG